MELARRDRDCCMCVLRIAPMHTHRQFQEATKRVGETRFPSHHNHHNHHHHGPHRDHSHMTIMTITISASTSTSAPITIIIIHHPSSITTSIAVSMQRLRVSSSLRDEAKRENRQLHGPGTIIAIGSAHPQQSDTHQHDHRHHQHTSTSRPIPLTLEQPTPSVAPRRELTGTRVYPRQA